MHSTVVWKRMEEKIPPLTILRLLVLVVAVISSGRSPKSLDSELRRLAVKTALVLPSSAIDDSPVWSPDSRFVAVNVGDTWQKVDLNRLDLEPGKWRTSRAIGVLKSQTSISPLSPVLLKEWVSDSESRNETDPRRPATRVEFRHEELSTLLVITRGEGPPETLWRSDLETCGAPVVSPDGRYVAFICEMNGLFVMQLK